MIAMAGLSILKQLRSFITVPDQIEKVFEAEHKDALNRLRV